jgi:protein-S-isoprenylcysteine O-methyltransferase Ste14
VRQQVTIMRKVLLALTVAAAATAAVVLIDQANARFCQVAGAVLIAVGIPLLIVSRIHLGKAFAIAPKAKMLVTSGVYAKVPHPLYTFLDVALLGLVLALRMPWLVLVWLALVCAHAWEARREAKVLEAAFGDAYRNYRARTWW